MTVDFTEEYPFKGGTVEAKFITRDDKSKVSVWKVTTGSFVCRDCGRQYFPGADINPVTTKKEVTNFVCLYCRGLLDPLP